MNRDNFPLVAIILGFVFVLIITFGSQVDEAGGTMLPLFTLLAICEFGFLVNAAGAFLSAKRLRDDGFAGKTAGLSAVCVLLALIFLNRGLILWPG